MDQLAAKAGEPKIWFTASELADMNLPGLASKRNRVVDIATAQRWAERYNAAGEPLFRKRAGRGGGYEYHIDVLPPMARLELAKRDAPAAIAPEDDTGTWSWFELQSDKVKTEAKRRLTAVQAVDAAVRSGLKKNAAVATVCADLGVSASTLYEWLGTVSGVVASDWMPMLAPRRKRVGVKADIDPELLTFFKSFYLRPSPVGFEQCYRETVKEAARRGLTLPGTKTLTRRLRAEVPQEVILLKRKGMEAVINSMPAQKRTRATLHAMEGVNVDGHKWDVFVRWPDGRVGRPISVVIQDLYSNKILAWRTGDTESAVMTRLAFADLFKNWGIPKHVTLDNGRAFASKWLTGGAKTRFRFKIRDEDPIGLFPALGIAIHWAKPHHGQAKPIERAFRDLEEIISMSPECQGAYTGNKPDAKPDDYGSRAIEYAEFEQLIAAGVADYNAREGRRTETAQGASFDETFRRSYAENPIGQAAPEQLRLALLTADNVRAHRKTGAVSLYGNDYYAPPLYALAGQMVTVRFDPEALQTEVHVYKTTGEFVATAPVHAAVGFYDVDAAKKRAKLEGDLRKSVRETARLQGLKSAADLARREQAKPKTEDAPRPAVVRPVRTRGSAAAKPAAVHQVDAVSFNDRFGAAVEQLASSRPDRQRFTLLDGGLTPQAEPERPKE